MTRFAAPIAEQIWDMKYRLKDADGTPIDATIEDTWARIAKSLASVEKAPSDWEPKFYKALEDFRYLPAGRITAGAGTDRSVTLFNCFVMGTIPDTMSGIFDNLREAAGPVVVHGCLGCDVPHHYVGGVAAWCDDGHDAVRSSRCRRFHHC